MGYHENEHDDTSGSGNIIYTLLIFGYGMVFGMMLLNLLIGGV